MLITRSFLRPAADTNGVAKPQLTSLVDMLTILLVFLLKSFSVEGSLVTASEQLTLPESTSRVQPAVMVNVEITQSAINIDGETVTTVASLADSDTMLVAPLYDGLRQIAERTGSSGEENRLTIQCDRSIDFRIVKKIMFTCAQASFSDFSLLVNREV